MDSGTSVFQEAAAQEGYVSCLRSSSRHDESVVSTQPAVPLTTEHSSFPRRQPPALLKFFSEALCDISNPLKKTYEVWEDLACMCVRIICASLALRIE